MTWCLMKEDLRVEGAKGCVEGTELWTRGAASSASEPRPAVHSLGSSCQEPLAAQSQAAWVQALDMITHEAPSAPSSVGAGVCDPSAVLVVKPISLSGSVFALGS